ncbi:uncharacterized protein [Coffea arabica]|uniref:Uncharacterized protein n=1 Tax=Coffea arabica TaxID=13443 RepID=A0ABM4X7C5_COFAR
MGGDSQNSRKRTYRQANSDQVEPGSQLTEVITFGPNDPIPAASSNHETLVIEVLTNNYIVKNVYVNLENSVDIMYYRTFESLKLTRDQLTSVRTPLVGFGGHVVHSEGIITLMVTIGCHPHCHTITVNFAVVKVDSPYNLLIGRPMLNALWAVYSTYHLSFKFLTPAGMAEIGKPARLEIGDEVKEVILDALKSDQAIRIEMNLLVHLKEEMINLLKEHWDVFTWIADEIVGVLPELMLHRLNVDLRARSVKQKKRHFGPERNKAISSEVDKLLLAKMIKEIQYPT